MKVCKHDFRAIECSSAGHYGILLYCTKCGDTFSYDENWVLYPLDEM
jgi:hypothetical protein